MIAVADAIDADALRLRHEFLQVPGMRVSAAKAAQLLAISTRHAQVILTSLEREQFLLRVAADEWRLKN